MKKYALQCFNLLVLTMFQSRLTTSLKVERFDSGDVFKSINKKTCSLISNSIWDSDRCKCSTVFSTYSDIYRTHACYTATGLCSECDLYFENGQEKVLIPKPGTTNSEYLLYDKLYPDPRQSATLLSITLSILGNDGWSLIPDASINFTSAIRINVQSKRAQQLAGKILRLSFSCKDKPDKCVLLKISGEYISLLPLPSTSLKSREPFISSATYTKLRYYNSILSTTSAGSSTALPKNYTEELSNFSTVNLMLPKNQSLIGTTDQSFFNMTVRNTGNSNGALIIGITVAVAIVSMFVICGTLYKRNYRKKIPFTKASLRGEKPVHGYVNNTFQRADTISNTQSSNVHKTKDACFEENREVYSNLREINPGHYQQLYQKTPSIIHNNSEYSELDASIASSSIKYPPDRFPEYESPFKTVDSRPQLAHTLQNTKALEHDVEKIGSQASKKHHPYFTIE